jgi:hypothetical protein
MDADEHLAKVKEHLQEAIQHLSDAADLRTPGSEDWRSAYRTHLYENLARLVNIRGGIE